MTKTQHTNSEQSNKFIRSTDHHDKLFKRFFSIPAFAKELLLLMFSPAELKGLDLSQIKVEKDSWINKMADLVLSLPFKNHPDKRFTLFIILEHKSTYDPLLWTQLFFYQASLYEHTRKKGLPLMPIMPGVFYHGKEPWQGPLNFQKGVWGSILKAFGNMAQFVIDYKIKLLSTHDLKLKRAMSNKSFKSHAVLNLMAKVWDLKASPEGLKEVVSLFGELADEREDFILYVLEYLESMKLVTADSWRSLEKQLTLEGTFKKGGFMDIREEIKERARMEGMQQERQQVVLNMLKEEVDMNFICKVTGLSQQEINKLKNGS